MSLLVKKPDENLKVKFLKEVYDTETLNMFEVNFHFVNQNKDMKENYLMNDYIEEITYLNNYLLIRVITYFDCIGKNITNFMFYDNQMIVCYEDEKVIITWRNRDEK